jgi:hypothetical protein
MIPGAECIACGEPNSVCSSSLMYWDGVLGLWMHRVCITGFRGEGRYKARLMGLNVWKNLLLSNAHGDEWPEGLETPSRVTLNK